MRKIRDLLNLLLAIMFSWLYIPHVLLFLFCNGKRKMIKADMIEYMKRMNVRMCNLTAFIYLLHHDRYFRVIFYHRAGVAFPLLFGWWRPGDRYFIISKTTKIGKGMFCPHPYSTIINAESVGRNFVCHQLVTIGNKDDESNRRPKIGDDVNVGANVSIIGPITIGNHVTIGAGSVVINDVPDNCVVAGCPAKIIKKYE